MTSQTLFCREKKENISKRLSVVILQSMHSLTEIPELRKKKIIQIKFLSGAVVSTDFPQNF